MTGSVENLLGVADFNAGFVVMCLPSMPMLIYKTGELWKVLFGEDVCWVLVCAVDLFSFVRLLLHKVDNDMVLL